MRFIKRLASSTKGATVVEYGFILALIFLAMMAGVAAVGSTTSGMWNNVSDSVRNNT